MQGSRSEPISLTTLDRDCFIIPVQSLDRFLPAGIPVITALFPNQKAKKFNNFFYSFHHHVNPVN